MKIALWALGGIIAIIIVVMGVGAYWATSVKVDFKDPAVATKFKDTFAANCVATYRQRASKAGQTIPEDQNAKLDQACACWRDGVVAALAKREPMTAMQIAGLLSSDPELKTIAQGCSTQSGIEEPL
ncbi:MAG TPA: hypothetical protein VHE77_21435 [Dongiaceae bacterium]|jgi:hypothetical protein|nr:hypothetical protein [Dongiaceae bacterium]